MAVSGGGEDSVAERRRHRRHRRLADAAPKIAARHDHGFDPRHAVDAQHPVGVEIRLLDGAVFDRDFTVKRRGQRIDDGALGLHFDPEWVDHMAGIDRGDRAMDADKHALQTSGRTVYTAHAVQMPTSPTSAAQRLLLHRIRPRLPST